MSEKYQADRKLNEACRMIIQAKEAGFIDDSKAREALREAVSAWEAEIERITRRNNPL